MIENSTQPFYGYYALSIFTIISAIVIVNGIVVAIFVWWLAGLVVTGVGVYIILSYGISIHFARLISKNLRKSIDTYRSLLPHVVAAIQMAEKGKRLRRKETMNSVYIDADNMNLFRRVIPAELMEDADQYYDKNKYVQLVLDVAETILGVFGFSRKRLGEMMKPRDHLEEIRIERSTQRLAELRSLMDSMKWD